MQHIIKDKLNKFRLINENRKSFYFKAITGPSKTTKIPKKLDNTLCCYIGLIIGDGHIKKDKKRISIELVDEELIRKIEKITQNLFGINSSIYKIKDKRPNRKIRYLLQVDNSPLHCFLNEVIKIPKGNKSSIVEIPELIKNSNLKNKVSFLIGLFAADGGKRNHSKIGLSSASKKLRDDISYALKEQNIKHFKDNWIYKKYKKEYFGIYFTRKSLNQLMRGCRSGQTGQIQNSFLEKIGGQA